MDPLSILGAAAASAQLGQQAYHLISFFADLHGTLKEAPELTRARVLHIEQLQSVSKLIENTLPLQTDEIRKVVIACLMTASKLVKILTRYSLDDKKKLKRLLSSVKISNREDEILLLLDRIEKEKSLLAICIHQVDATQLQSLNLTVSEVQRSVGISAIQINDTAANVRILVDIAPDLASQVHMLHKEVPEILLNIQEQLSKLAFPRLQSPQPVPHLRQLVWNPALLLFVLIPLLIVTTFRSGHVSIVEPIETIFEVPNHRVKNFVGREDTLKTMKSILHESHGHSPRIVVLRGMGGQGKTQLALEFCQRLKNVIDVFWVDATSEQSVKGDFALLSHLLDPGLSPSLDMDTRVATTRRMLAQRSDPWLMVFDNYDDPLSYNIRSFITNNQFATILVTSRHREVSHLADPGNRIELQGLKKPDAIKLLLTDNYKNSSSEVGKHSAIIVERLAYHPLAIAQANAYINSRDLQLPDFLLEYDDCQEEILRNTAPQMTEYRKKPIYSDHEIPMSVFTTSELSFQQLLRLEQHQSSELLTLLAYFDSRDISEVLLKSYCPSRLFQAAPNAYPLGLPIYPSHETNPIKFSSYLDALCQLGWSSRTLYRDALQLNQLSLVEFSPSSKDDKSLHLSLHPIIRDWIRLRTQQAERLIHVSVAARCIYRMLVMQQTKRNWLEYNLGFAEREQLIRHIDAYAQNMDLLSQNSLPSYVERFVYPDDMGLPAFEFGRLLHKHAQYASSEKWARLSLRQRTAQLGGEDPRTLLSMGQLALVLGSQRQYSEAERLQNHVLRVKERTFGNENPSTLATRLNLAELFTSQGKYQEAEDIDTQVLKTYQTVLGDTDPNTVVAMAMLGNLLNLQKKFGDAEPLNRRGLLLAKRAFGLHHYRTLAAVGLHGVSLVGLNRLEEAESLLRDALAVRQKEWGKGHPDTIECMKQLCIILSRRGEYQQIRDLILSAGYEQVQDSFPFAGVSNIGEFLPIPTIARI